MGRTGRTTARCVPAAPHRTAHRGVLLRRCTVLRRDDSGSMLLEALMAVVVISVVMIAVTGLLITSSRATAQQRDSQVAVQLATSGIDLAHQIGGVDAFRGRSEIAVKAQWREWDDPAAHPDVAAWLATMTPGWDDNPVSGVSEGEETLPTTAAIKTINDRTYHVNYLVGRCWQQAASGECGKDEPSDSDAFQMVQVVVAATWDTATCPDTGCIYVSATLLDAQPPVVELPSTPPETPSTPPDAGPGRCHTDPAITPYLNSPYWNSDPSQTEKYNTYTFSAKPECHDGYTFTIIDRHFVAGNYDGVMNPGVMRCRYASPYGYDDGINSGHCSNDTGNIIMYNAPVGTYCFEVKATNIETDRALDYFVTWSFVAAAGYPPQPAPQACRS